MLTICGWLYCKMLMNFVAVDFVIKNLFSNVEQLSVIIIGIFYGNICSRIGYLLIYVLYCLYLYYSHYYYYYY